MQEYDPFHALIEPLIQSGMSVLDIGAGDGSLAKRLAEKGAKVQAIDQRVPEGDLGAVLFQKKSAQELVVEWETNTSMYDAIILADVIQFMEKSWVLDVLLPACKRHLNQNGLLLIESFRLKANPPFEVSALFTEKDFENLGLFVTWSASPVFRGLGLDGRQREFFLVQYVGKKIE